MELLLTYSLNSVRSGSDTVELFLKLNLFAVTLGIMCEVRFPGVLMIFSLYCKQGLSVRNGHAIVSTCYCSPFDGG